MEANSTTTPDMDQTVCYGSDEEENDSNITYVESTNEESDNPLQGPSQQGSHQQTPMQHRWNHQGASQHGANQQGPIPQGPKQKPSRNKFMEIFKIDSDTNSNVDPYFFSDSESD